MFQVFQQPRLQVEADRETRPLHELPGEPVLLLQAARTPPERAGQRQDVPDAFRVAEGGVGGGETTVAGTGDHRSYRVVGDVVGRPTQGNNSWASKSAKRGLQGSSSWRASTVG